MGIILVEPEEETKETNDDETCPSRDHHTWYEIEVGNTCLCAEWQVLKIIDVRFFWAIDVSGKRERFERA